MRPDNGDKRAAVRVPSGEAPDQERDLSLGLQPIRPNRQKGEGVASQDPQEPPAQTLLRILLIRRRREAEPAVARRRLRPRAHCRCRLRWLALHLGSALSFLTLNPSLGFEF